MSTFNINSPVRWSSRFRQLLPSALIEPRHVALSLAHLGLLFEVLQLVTLGLALAHADLDFHTTVFPVGTQGHEGLALLLAGGPETHDFILVQQKPARTARLMLLVAGLHIRLDVAA